MTPEKVTFACMTDHTVLNQIIKYAAIHLAYVFLSLRLIK